jgi:hypothetical protein
MVRKRKNLLEGPNTGNADKNAKTEPINMDIEGDIAKFAHDGFTGGDLELETVGSQWNGIRTEGEEGNEGAKLGNTRQIKSKPTTINSEHRMR